MTVSFDAVGSLTRLMVTKGWLDSTGFDDAGGKPKEFTGGLDLF